MTECDICRMIEKKESFKVIFEDENMIGMLHEAPASIGHTMLIPKNHFRILEEVPEELTSQMFNISNKISTALFESLNIHGTNILVNNGPDAGQTLPHFIINIIPRTESDGINTEWPMQQADMSKLDKTHGFLKEFVDKSVLEKADNQIIEEKEELVKSDEDDYMIKQFKRMP